MTCLFVLMMIAKCPEELLLFAFSKCSSLIGALYSTKGLRPPVRDKQEDSFVKVAQILEGIVAEV